MMPTLSSLVLPDLVIETTVGVDDDKAGITMTPGFQETSVGSEAYSFHHPSCEHDKETYQTHLTSGVSFQLDLYFADTI